MMVVVCSQLSSGQVTLIDSLRRAGFTIAEAWPIDTERVGRLHEFCCSYQPHCHARKRFICGNYAMEVRPKLAEIVKKRVKTLMEEGVTGADLVIACIGAGLRAYTNLTV